MLPLVLALTASSLVLTGESGCPTVGEVDAALAALRPRTEALPAWVEITAHPDTVYLSLWSGDRTLHAVHRLVAGGDCLSLAAQAAAMVVGWENDPQVLKVSLPRAMAPLKQPPAARVPELEDAETSRAWRLPLTALGAVLGALIPFALTMTASGTERATVFLGTTALFGPPLVALTAYAGHRIGHGESHYGWAMLGAILGLAGEVLAFGMMSNYRGDWVTPREPIGPVVGMLLLMGVPATILELSDQRERGLMREASTP